MIVYSKFSTNRKKEYQITTTIEKRAHNYVVNKIPATQNAVEFLYSILDKYDRLKQHTLPFQIAKPYRSDKNKISFQFVEQDSYDYLLQKALIKRDLDEFLNLLNRYCALIRSIPSDNVLPDERFNLVFGKALNKSVPSCVVGCLDLNFDNIFFSGEATTLIDFEWTFPFPIPSDFIIFRAIIGFYGANKSYRPNALIKIFDLFEKVGIPRELHEVFMELEECFQSYVFGHDDEDEKKVQNPNRFKDAYENLGKDSTTQEYTHALLTLNAYTVLIENEAVRKNKWILKLEDAISQKDQWIAKLEKDNQELNVSVVETSRHIQSLQNQTILSKATEVIDRSKEDQTLRQYIKDLEAESERKNGWILKLEDAVERKTTWAKKLEKDIEELNREINTLQWQVSQYKPTGTP